MTQTPTNVPAESSDYTREEYLQSQESYRSPYEEWKAAEGLPTIRGYFVRDLLEIECTPWKSRGGSGVFINLDGTGGFNDAFVYNLAPKESSEPIHHIYEELVFILQGHGTTDFSVDKKTWQSVEWQERSYFAIPPNCWYQHHNGSGQEPARFIATSSAPRVIDTFKDLDFVFNNPFIFKDHFVGEKGYFIQSDLPSSTGVYTRRWLTNFVSDVMEVLPPLNKVGTAGRGGGTTARSFGMVNGTQRSHFHATPPAACSTFHRHGPGIHIVLLAGQGYSMTWQDEGEMERVDWAPYSIFVPPERWWHAHFNTGAEPAYFLAMGWGSDRPNAGGKSYVYKAFKDGGDQMTYDDEDPAIHQEFHEALARNGVECQMKGVHPYCK